MRTLHPLRSAKPVLLLALAASLPSTHAQETALPAVTVTGVRPLPGLAVPLNEVAAPVQTAGGEEMRRSGALNLADFMNTHLGSVHVNETQGNPFQPDVNYRGYTASPLPGAAQGLSVYMDGVRMNQAFGDVVSWDLIPKSAIRSVTLVPGSNPLFGLNTLGGALSIETKDGFSNPGTSVTGTVGSHARRSIELEHGGSNADGLGWFVSADAYRDNGWREDSASRVGQLFGKLGWRDGSTNLNLSLSHADNALNGNGLQEQRFLARDWRSVYTRPDVTDNRATLLNLSGIRELDDGISVSGLAYYRRITTRTVNGDINEESLNQSLYQPNAAERAALSAAGYSGFPASGANAANTPFPSWRCIAQALRADEPAEKCNGLINRSQTGQSAYGLAGQVALDGSIAGKRNQFTAGAAYNGSRMDFRQSTQLGFLNPDRSITGVNAFGDGVTGGDVDGEPYDSRVDIGGRQRTWSLFATDTFSIRDNLHLILSGRYNRTSVNTRDNIHADGPQSLNGDHRFSRFNPAIGLTYSPLKSLNVYAGYNEGTRTPSGIELGCANPDQPCKLPNAMAGDPPLKQVVTRTWEAGMRGQVQSLSWSAGMFRAINADDILFVADDQAGYGYFRNVGKTRRQGVELGASNRFGQLSLGAHYTFLDATFQSRETVNGSSNSNNDRALAGVPGVDGTIGIEPGNRLPLVPRHMLKLNADYQATPQLNIGLNMIALSGMLARGNENGLHQPDGLHYLGKGKTAGYAVFNLGGSYRPESRFEYLAQVNNLFDRRNVTAAQLGPTGFDGAGQFVARPFPAAGGEFGVQRATFYAPGAPRAIWVGLRHTL
ncbi:TonB-dependent receptor [Noviherbaspirillum denitrificans]|uniref:TonB-dependent receptor n=1 Tax=Noviherbaspirillum denitrificans TaxID=1968433 RepID=A0A254TKJ0_9BURK|nr:TonB-dependent receptor [Noviherbaspirillum denitrificans]OWW20228.1 TonB-dependent receptor [Noviherbaspirillum denitrificans]